MIKYIHSLTLQKYIAFEGVYILIDFIMYYVSKVEIFQYTNLATLASY